MAAIGPLDKIGDGQTSREFARHHPKRT